MVDKTNGIFSGRMIYNPQFPKTDTTDTTQETKEVVGFKAKQPSTTEMGRDLLNTPTGYYPNLTFTGGVSPTFASLGNEKSTVIKAFDAAYLRGDFGNGEGVDKDFAEGWGLFTACATMPRESRERIEQSMALWAV